MDPCEFCSVPLDSPRCECCRYGGYSDALFYAISDEEV